MSDSLRAKTIRLAAASDGDLKTALVQVLSATMEPNKYYALKPGKGGYDLRGGWFLAQSVQKNGSMRGLMVMWNADRRVPEKAKITQVDTRWAADSWVSTEESAIDPKVMARFRDRA